MKKMKKILIFLITFLIGLALFYWVIKWVGWKEVREVLFTFYGYKGITILALTISIWLSGFWKWNFILRSQGYKFPILRLGEIYFASKTITYLFTPTVLFGGEVFRAYAVKTKFSLPWEKNLAVLAIEKILGLSVLLIFLILGIISFLFLSQLPFKNFGILAIIIIGILAVGLCIFYFRSFKKESILKQLIKFFGFKKTRNRKAAEEVEKEIFRFFDFKKNLIWKGFGIAFVRYSLILFRCWLIVFFLKGEAAILASFAIFFFLYLSFILPIPTALGSSEAAQAFVFGSLGLGRAAGITFSFIIRGTEILVAIFGLILLIKLTISFLLKNTVDKFKVK